MLAGEPPATDMVEWIRTWASPETAQQLVQEYLQSSASWAGGGMPTADGQPSRAAVSKALARLEGFRFVGLTDEWAKSVCLLHRMHGDRPCVAAELLNKSATRGRTPDPTARRAPDIRF